MFAAIVTVTYLLCTVTITGGVVVVVLAIILGVCLSAVALAKLIIGYFKNKKEK